MIKNTARKKGTLVAQIFGFFLIGLILTSGLSYLRLKRLADRNIFREKEMLSAGIAQDVERSIREYTSYEWVLQYLIDHVDEDLDLEYESSEKTAEKEKKLVCDNEDFMISRATEDQIKTLSEDEQKQYAEIVFNRWLLRLNDLKQAYNVSYLYVFAADDDYEDTLFLISASDGTLKRGSQLGEAYVFGTKVHNTADQTKAFRMLQNGEDHLVNSGDYVDRYRYLFRIGQANIVTGMTFEVAQIRANADRTLRQNLLNFMILQIILAVFCLTMVFHFAIRPLQKVRKNVSEYASTKDSEKVRAQLQLINERNEIGELADGFSEMIGEIDAHLEKIRQVSAEKERISAELNVATRIQAGMLPGTFPPFPDISEFDIYATMKPAKEVGGDFYDFFRVGENRIALVVADVSGKGVPAALFMVIAKTLIKSRALLGGSPAEILYDVNNQLCEGNTSQYFVTVWLAILDYKTGEGLSANAGHEHPAFMGENGRFELVKYRHAPALGGMENIKFREREFRLKPGDRIFMYTDGVPEASNSRNELFGTERMLDALNMDGRAAPAELLKNLKREIDRFVGDATQFDDMTMLVFDMRGPL